MMNQILQEQKNKKSDMYIIPNIESLYYGEDFSTFLQINEQIKQKELVFLQQTEGGTLIRMKDLRNDV